VVIDIFLFVPWNKEIDQQLRANSLEYIPEGGFNLRSPVLAKRFNDRVNEGIPELLVSFVTNLLDGVELSKLLEQRLLLLPVVKTAHQVSDCFYYFRLHFLEKLFLLLLV